MPPRTGRQRGWWAKYGALPTNYSMYVGLEGAASEIRTFELAVVPGLLQTEEYARAISLGAFPDQPDEVTKRVDLRLARQACLTEEPLLRLWAVIDEGVVRRRTGGGAVIRDQLRHLVDMSKRPNITIQVLPFSEGWHPGTTGSFSVLDFPDGVHSPVAYVVSPAGEMYLEREDEVRRSTLAYTYLQTAALSAGKSRDLMATLAKEVVA